MQLRHGKLGGTFVPILFLVGVATFVVHEFFHWLAGVSLGYPMIVTPNRVFSETPMTAMHALAVSAAGPIATYVQAIVGYHAIRTRESLAGFALVYMAFFMRLVAMAVSVFNPNDEARISRDLGLGLWTLPAIVVSMLFILVFASSRRLKLTLRDQLLCYTVASIVVTAFVGADQVFFRKA